MQSTLQNLEATFEGKETEHNWSKRHEACRDILPALCKSDAAKENPARFAVGIRSFIDGLMACAKSERTQLSNEACKALQEVSKSLGHNIHPMIDIILPQLVDVSGFTKPVSQKNGSETVESIIRYAGYHSRLLHYITSTSSDKRKPPRVAAAKWLKVFIAAYRHDIEKVTASLDLIEHGIITGLNDQQKDVREEMRATYWTFSKYWSPRAEALMATLAKPAQTALLGDKHNPNQRSATPSAPKVSKKGTSEQTRAFILAQKKKRAQEVSTSAVSSDDATKNHTSVDIPQTATKARDNTIEVEARATPAELQRVPSGLLAEPARRRIIAVSTARPPPVARTASAVPSMVTPQAGDGPSSRPTSAQSAMPPPVASISASRPVSVASTAAMSYTSSSTIKTSTRKPLVSKQRLHDIMTKPLEGADEENKENERAHGLTDKREWARKETAEVSLRSISPLTKDPTAARKIIARGIKSITERSIDDVGYRRLQGVIKEHDDIFHIDEPKYEHLMLALFNAIEIPDTTQRVALGRKHDSTFQMLIIMRLMLKHNQKYFSSYHARALNALITARGNFEARCHIVSGLEQTAEDIVKVCNPSDVIDAVLMIVESAGKPDGPVQDDLDQDLLDERGARCTAMGLHVLSGLIDRTKRLSLVLDNAQEQRLTALGMSCLRSYNISIKRAVIEYCVSLHQIVHPESRFYELLTNGMQDLESLITYYVIASQASTTKGKKSIITA